MVAIDRYPKKPCKFCHKTNPNHFPYTCPINPKVALKRKVGLKRTPLKKVGKQTKQWIITRATWIRKNPPPIDGKYWMCYLRVHPWCPGRIDIAHLTLDHVVSRTRDVTKRFALYNLKPACIYCNGKKGSKSLDQIKPKPV